MTDNYLNTLWRKAVLAYRGNWCMFCPHREEDPGYDDSDYQELPVEAHHLIRRSVQILRHDYRNGVPLCVPHHRYAETRTGRIELWQLLPDHEIYYLVSNKNVILSDILIAQGKTIEEWRNEKAVELRRIINDTE